MRRTKIRGIRLQILLAILSRPGLAFHGGELQARFGSSKTNVWNHLRALRRHGLIAWGPNSARTIRATCQFIPAEAR